MSNKNRQQPPVATKKPVTDASVDAPTGAPDVPAPANAEVASGAVETTVLSDNATTDGDAQTSQTDAAAEAPAPAPEFPPAPDTPTPSAPAPEAPPVTATVAPVVEEPTEPETIYSYMQKKYPKLVDIPTQVKSVIEKMEAYITNMGTGVPVIEANGAKHQMALYNTFLTAMGAPAGQHLMTLDTILWYVTKELNGAFAARRAARFLDSDKFNKQQRDALVSLINLFTVLADPTTRRQLNSLVNIETVAGRLSSLDHKRRLLEFVSRVG